MSDMATAVRRGGRVLVLLAVALGGLVLLGRTLANFYAEVLWHDSAGYVSLFWTRALVEGGMRLSVGLLTALVAFLNFRVVARTVGSIQIKRQFGDLEIAERIPARIVFWGVVILSLFLGLWLGASFPGGAGLRFLLSLRAPSWDLVASPVGRDVSYFVFVLPVIGGALIFGLSLLFLLFTLSAAGYAATGSLTFREGKPRIAPLPRKHLTVLGGLFLLFLAGRFWIAQDLLLLDGNSGVQGIFGFADAEARLPGFRALSFFTLGAAGVTWWAGFRNRLAPLASAGIALVLGGLILVQGYPEVIQRFRVEPNELERETPFIAANLEFTRNGFGLHDMERRRYGYDGEAEVPWDAAAEQFAGLPIWTSAALLKTFREVEARFRYYDFEEVAVDRYSTSSGRRIPVAVSAREIDPGGIEDPNWQNRHLRNRYLAGMGAVASDATESTPEGRPPMFLSGIPPVFSGGPRAPEALDLTDPMVYFGSRSQVYAIVNPDSLQTGAAVPGASPAGKALGVTGDELIPQGIRLTGLLRTLALAWRFGDANLLFASEVTGESRFVFRRNVVERAQTLAPFLRFLEAPYPVIHDGRIVWILDAFTATRNFPLASPQDLPGGGSAAYLRNSVKVTVDAVSGETRFYRLDTADPLLEAWSRIFPDLFRPLEEMPASLRAHIRYPRALLEVQARVLLQYHQETPPRFHGQQDVWAFPQELSQGTRPVPYVPEYGIYRLPGGGESEFLLTTVFVPTGRQNLTALLAARCDPERYGELVLFDIPVEEQVPGPRQVEALVEQDPVISQQFSLWRQGGSQVWSGHLHVVPVGSTLFYLEPIFLAAEADAIPELRRLVLSDGRRVAMEASLEEAIAALALAGGEAEAALEAVAGESAEPVTPGSTWPTEAMELLDAAEDRLREGDWAGFGSALEELRSLLRSLSSLPGGG